MLQRSLLPALVAPILLLCLPGCVARTAVNAATLPVRGAVAVTGAAVDAVTTSEAERDRARGRELRRQEEAAERERRRAERDERRAAREAARRPR